ncbi:hypothetical protein HRbin21_01523 [bacterium HR21]|nr:hypothetical protein HRbin21_01523 [bacterium HR21]
MHLRWICLTMSIPAVCGAIPQFVLLTGNRCSACHAFPQGSGLRSELGWYSLHDVGLLRWHQLGLGTLERWWERAGNSLWDGRLLFGIDARLQGFESHNPAYASGWRLFPMQGALHVGISPIKALSLRATLNGGRLVFPGQQRWSASLGIYPGHGMPELQLGFFRPAVGLHYDDHTMLLSRIPGAQFDSPQQTYLLAPNFAQWGALLQWASLSWLATSVGVFRGGALSAVVLRNPRGESAPVTAATAPVGNAHLWLTPKLGSWTLSLGGSWLGNRDFWLAHGFAGIGWHDHGALWAEYSRFRSSSLHRWAVTAEIDLWLWNVMMPYARFEHGRVSDSGWSPAPYTTHLVLGAQLFVLPFVELRPEYRWADTEGYRSGRVALQLHVFY